MKPYKDQHAQGVTEIVPPPDQGLPYYVKGDIGLEVEADGRIWICLNGIAFLRFRKYLPIERRRENDV